MIALVALLWLAVVWAFALVTAWVVFFRRNMTDLDTLRLNSIRLEKRIQAIEDSRGEEVTQETLKPAIERLNVLSKDFLEIKARVQTLSNSAGLRSMVRRGEHDSDAA